MARKKVSMWRTDLSVGLGHSFSETWWNIPKGWLRCRRGDATAIQTKPCSFLVVFCTSLAFSVCASVSLATAQGIGIFQRDDCTTITNPVAGKSYCYDQRANTLKKWTGVAWVAIANERQAYRVVDDGAKFDGVEVTDAAMDAGQATLSTPTMSCGAGDVKKVAWVYGAGAGGTLLSTTVSSCSGSAFVLAASASTAVTGARFLYGSDDTAAIQATLNRLVRGTDTPNPNVELPVGITFISAGLSTANSVSNFTLYGAGQSSTKIFWNGAPDTTMLLLQRARNVTIRGFTLHGKSTATPKYGIEVRGLNGNPPAPGYVGAPAPQYVTIDNMWIGSMFGEYIQRAVGWTPGGLKTATDGAMISGSHYLDSRMIGFTESDVGKWCTVPGALKGGRLGGYITSYVSPTRVLLSRAASMTVAGKNFQCSWDANNERGIIRNSTLQGAKYGLSIEHLNSRWHVIESSSVGGGSAGVSNVGPLGLQGGSFSAVNSIFGSGRATGYLFEIGPAEDQIHIINGTSEDPYSGGLLKYEYTQDTTNGSVLFTGGSFIVGGRSSTCMAGSGISDHSVIWNTKAGRLTFNNTNIFAPYGVTHCYPSAVSNPYDGVFIDGGMQNVKAIKANVRVSLSNLSMLSPFSFSALSESGHLLSRDNYGQANSGADPITVTSGTSIDVSAAAPIYQLVYRAPTTIDRMTGGRAGQVVTLCGSPGAATNVTLRSDAAADSIAIPDTSAPLLIGQCRSFVRSSAEFGSRWYELSPGITQYVKWAAAPNVSDGGKIRHGMSTTPTACLAQSTVAGEIASVTEITGQDMTVALRRYDGSAGARQTVYWQCVR